MALTFKETYRDLQELVREHSLLRTHNRSFGPEDSQVQLLLFAEAALILIIIERFLRILPDFQFNDRATLGDMLRAATNGPSPTLRVSPKIVKGVISIRNSILHGNFEQAASGCGL